MGIIFQEPLQLETATLEENVLLPLELKGALSPATRKRINELLKKLGLGSKIALLPSSLSVGEKALMGIARALVSKPMIIVADEPLAHLDAIQAEAAEALLLEAHKYGTSLIVLTRDEELAARLPGRTLTLEKGSLTEGGKAPRAKTTPHHILRHEEEEAEGQTHESDGTPLITKGGRKVKITPIGSSLQ
jgi:ABC-type ATPase involved in cell division